MAEGQDRVLLWTYFHTAGRRQEVLNLKWEDVDFTRQRLRLYTRKRRGGNLEADWIDMTDELTAILREHQKSAVNEWVFVRLNKGIGYLQPFLTGRDKWPKDLCRKIGVKPFGCHGIRATDGHRPGSRERAHGGHQTALAAQEPERHRSLRQRYRFHQTPPPSLGGWRFCGAKGGLEFGQFLRPVYV